MRRIIKPTTVYFPDGYKATSWIYEHRGCCYIPYGKDETGSNFTVTLNTKEYSEVIRIANKWFLK